MNSEQKQESKELTYPLNKKIICSLCGNTFSSHSQKGKRYYRCQGYTRKKICTAKKIDADKIEKTIKDLTMKIIEDKWGEKPRNKDREEVYGDKAIHFVSDGLVQIKSNTLKLMMDMKDKDKTIEEKIEEYKKYSDKVKRLLEFDIKGHIEFLRKMDDDEEKAFEKAGRAYFRHVTIRGTVMYRADHYRNLKPEEFFNTCIKEIHYNINDKKGFIEGKILDFVKNFTL